MKLKNKLCYKEISSKRVNYWSYFLMIISIIFVMATFTSFTIYHFGRYENSKHDSPLFFTSFLNYLNGSYFTNNIENIKRNTREVKDLLVQKVGNNYYEEQRAVLVNADGPPPFFEQLDAHQDSHKDYQSYENGDNYHERQNATPNSYYEESRFVKPSHNMSLRRGNEKGLTSLIDEPKTGAKREFTYGLEENRPYQIKPLKKQQPNEINNKSEENIIVTVLKSLKQIWNIYQALSSAWNTIYEQRHQQLDQLIKLQNRKSEKHNINLNSNNLTHTKSSKYSRPRKSSITSTHKFPVSSSEKEYNKTEPEKLIEGFRFSQKQTETLRSKRSAELSPASEGRYIKGDPLKGYYDFVITEGSYKFWAVFQVGTAILIIYSTFAAIYYSKVNPLVGDYDYTDYLGGGRSLLSSDLDFVDDSLITDKFNSSVSWYNWALQSHHSIKFILDAIDKLPVDHKVTNDSFTERVWKY